MSITDVPGFVAGGIACGIKGGGVPDLAMVATEDRSLVPAAGVFTTNLAQAAPVQISKRHLADGLASAVVLNSGNANAATGEQGREHALRMCSLTAAGLGIDTDDVLVCSTGLIGIPLPIAPIETGIPELCTQLSPTGGADAARAMMTTDTVPKTALARAGAAAVGGIAKGAAMLSPAMATMLAVLTTDAEVAPATLQSALAAAVADTFDLLCVDGARSTNDTVLVLASGRAGEVAYSDLFEGLAEVCGSLAEQMARDAEGATKFVKVRVVGARSLAEARVAARAVADSQLVQCSLNGSDPYWGRVLSELGASGVHLDPEQVDIAYNGITVCRDGIAYAHDEQALTKEMNGPEIEILCDLRVAHGEATVLTTDLSHAYIDENRRTS